MAQFKPDNYRLLFLDIDDVLTSMRSVYAYYKYPHPNEYIEHNGEDNPELDWIITPLTKYKLVQDNPVLRKECFDLVAVGMLRRFCEDEDVHIVLSSTWRCGLDIKDVVLLLKTIGFDEERIIGRTSVQNGISETPYGKRVVRGMEVMDFVHRLRCEGGPRALIEDGLLLPEFLNYDSKTLFKGLSSYIIIDDSEDFLSAQYRNFVHIKEDGILLSDLKRMKAILEDVFPSFDQTVWHIRGDKPEGTEIPPFDT